MDIFIWNTKQEEEKVQDSMHSQMTLCKKHDSYTVFLPKSNQIY